MHYFPHFPVTFGDMRKFMKHLPLLSLLMLLSACDSVFTQGQTYTYVPPATRAGQICAKQCPVQKTQCLRSCEALRNNCIHEGKVNAQRSYLQYVNERMAQGLLVDKSQDQFYREPANCLSLKQCQDGCDIGMRACHTQCGGDILQNGNCLLNCAPKDPQAIDDEGGWF